MLKFEPCTLEVLKNLTPRFRSLPTLCTDLSAGTIWLWKEEQDPRICIQNDTIVLRQIMNGYPAFTWPVGPDADGMLDALIREAREENIALRFFAMDEEQLHALLRDPRFPDTMWSFDRRWSDYIYSFDELLAMEGKEFRRLRYRINHFERLYQPVIRPLSRADLPAAREMLDAYAAEHGDMDRLEIAEFRHTRDLLEACHDLSLPVAGLWVKDRLAGIGIGEIIGQTVMLHVEKALVRYKDIYPALFQGYLQFIRDSGYRDLRYINFEDDSGDPGLRELKNNVYHPEKLVHKYQAHVRTPAARMNTYPVLRGGRVVLTPFRETDMDTYYRMNTDRENNKYWGYDYEEDYTVPAHPTPKTFYDSAMFDMAVGDSINYAIRLTEDGPMIGEALLWNFTFENSVELGVRLLPEYIGKGLSRAGELLVEYAEDVLNCSVRVRCLNLPDNQRALGGARGSGFVEVGRDDTWVYLERKKK